MQVFYSYLAICRTTRDSFEGKGVVEYDAYKGMALKEMQSVCEDARKQWPGWKKYLFIIESGKFSASTIAFEIN